ncbi:MAG: NAD(P)H-dependent glycerol-3-phosphate dehydrogenase [Cellulosilyticaceae bacterium]
MSKIAIIGAGSWGLALGLLLNEKDNEVIFWCHQEAEKEAILASRENKRCLPGVKIPLEVTFTTSMAEALVGRDLVVLAVPSKVIRQTTKSMAPYLEPQTVVVNVSKGIEDVTYMTLSEVVESEVPNPVVVLSGPSHAEEVARHLPTTVVASSKNMEAAEYVQDAFMTQHFRVYTNPDILGVEIGAALKNVIALAAGIVEGMGFGDNTKAALITRGIAEISRLGVAMGADANTFSGLTGMGDLIVTCTSGHSRNRRAGELIGQGHTLDEAIKKVNMVVEGVPTTKGAYALMRKYNVDMPILNAIHEGLFEGKPIVEAVKSLMARDKKMEDFS